MCEERKAFLDGVTATVIEEVSRFDKSKVDTLKVIMQALVESNLAVSKRIEDNWNSIAQSL
jgi:hypothetical protein